MNPFLRLEAPGRAANAVAHDEAEGPVTVRDLGKLLTEAGLTWDAFTNAVWDLGVADAGNLLRYLDAAVFKVSATPEALRFHLRFLRSAPPADYPIWEDIVRSILDDRPLSNSSEHFLQSEGIDRLWRLMLASVRQEKITEPDGRPDARLLVQSLFRFLELADALVADDPNIPVVLDAVNRFGSLQQYFSKHDVPHPAIRALASAGFDANYLVFGSQNVLSRSREDQPERRTASGSGLDELITTIVGTEQAAPQIELGIDRFKFLNELADDREMVKTENSLPAARRLAARLIPLLRARKLVLQRLRLLVPASTLDEYIHRIERYAKVSDAEKARALEKITARRSTKNVPELFFDDTRLGSWLFKPEGIVHGEICRILLDPAVPLLEIWQEPYSEFMAAIPLYPGFNANRQRCILVETYHFDDRIFDLLGRQETLSFMLDALLFDAFLGQAEKLVVFAAPWGRSAIFANYVAELAKQNEAIHYFESYEFESVDPGASALQNSLTGQFHYTESLGYNRPLKGVIDFGFNLVGHQTIDKLTSGGRGVFEIDIQAFLGARHLLDSIPNKEKPAVEGTEAAFFDRPAEREAELTHRSQEKLRQAEVALRSVLPDAHFEIHREIDDATSAELLALHRHAFPEYAFVDEQYYAERMRQRDATLFVARSGGAMVGMTLTFRSGILPNDAVYIDELAVCSDQRQKGLGSALVELALRTASVRGTRQACLLTRFDPAGSPLMRFYERLNFRAEADYPDRGRLFQRSVSLFGRENREAIDAILARLDARLSASVPQLRIECFTAITPGLIEMMQSLETVFPEDIRYSWDEFSDRMRFRDAYVLVVKSGDGPIGFTLCYHDPILPDHVMFGDVLAVKQEWQHKRIGVELVKTVLEIPALTNYTDFLLYCTEPTKDGKSLVQYYRYFGGRVIDVADKVRMLIPLRANRAGSRRSVLPSPGQNNACGTAACALRLDVKRARPPGSRYPLTKVRASRGRSIAVSNDRRS
ncbi:GNAT family N-acetyltransferase [Bradyrhizobium uaiense]|uniref:GNAT family N-acetyltransferase n=1 Tax=Bradyrhizobium uaiense TaxID=2594946 RepID=A0A6P1BHQ2_9BRAD|nr:GNAT family N-acetyltransferase [Bradyrhizobium uaiense]NEU97915.1 GNAT family N-acetyltransferase [Bradyrhizobium uaiense]